MDDRFKIRINTDRNRLLEYETPKDNLSALDFGRINVLFLRKQSGSVPIALAPGSKPSWKELVDAAARPKDLPPKGP